MLQDPTPSPVAQSDACPTGSQEATVRHCSLVENDLEIFPMVILFLLLIKEEQLSIIGETA